jgi:hypothetical protein
MELYVSTNGENILEPEEVREKGRSDRLLFSPSHNFRKRTSFYYLLFIAKYHKSTPWI